MASYKASPVTWSVFIFLIAGAIMGLLYSLVNATDIFTLYSISASQQIISDSRIVWEREIYLWANTQYHVGLEVILSIISLVTGLPPTKLLYIPLGSVIYSLIMSLLFVNFPKLKNKHLPPRLCNILPLLVIMVLSSSGNYYSNFYSVFHISFGYPLL